MNSGLNLEIIRHPSTCAGRVEKATVGCISKTGMVRSAESSVIPLLDDQTKPYAPKAENIGQEIGRFRFLQ
jgi:hypothetical protein